MRNSEKAQCNRARSVFNQQLGSLREVDGKKKKKNNRKPSESTRVSIAAKYLSAINGDTRARAHIDDGSCCVRNDRRYTAIHVFSYEKTSERAITNRPDADASEQRDFDEQLKPIKERGRGREGKEHRQDHDYTLRFTYSYYSALRVFLFLPFRGAYKRAQLRHSQSRGAIARNGITGAR